MQDLLNLRLKSVGKKQLTMLPKPLQAIIIRLRVQLHIKLLTHEKTRQPFQIDTTSCQKKFCITTTKQLKT